jgi:hypothetical protein
VLSLHVLKIKKILCKVEIKSKVHENYSHKLFSNVKIKKSKNNQVVFLLKIFSRKTKVTYLFH